MSLPAGPKALECVDIADALRALTGDASRRKMALKQAPYVLNPVLVEVLSSALSI